MFGIGFGELIVIAFLSILVFGPDRLPVLAKQAGQAARKLRNFANNARDELRSELGPDYADLELRDLDPREIVRRHIAEALAEEEDDDFIGPKRDLRPLADGERPPYDLEAT